MLRWCGFDAIASALRFFFLLPRLFPGGDKSKGSADGSPPGEVGWTLLDRFVRDALLAARAACFASAAAFAALAACRASSASKRERSASTSSFVAMRRSEAAIMIKLYYQQGARDHHSLALGNVNVNSAAGNATPSRVALRADVCAAAARANRGTRRRERRAFGGVESELNMVLTKGRCVESA